MSITWPTKDPDETLDYGWDVPLDAGDTIVAHSVTRDSGTAVKGSDSATDARVTVWISGGADGETSVFTLRATTDAGRTFETTAYLAVASSATFSSNFKAAFPRFAAVPDSSIAFWQARAERIVTDCFGADQDFATMLLTAHYLVLAGLGAGAEAQMAAQGASGFTRIKSGTIELERGKADASASSFASTSYGTQFLPLLRAYKGGPRVTASGSLPCYGAYPWA